VVLCVLKVPLQGFSSVSAGSGSNDFWNVKVKNHELKANVEKMLFVDDYKPPGSLRKLAAEEYERGLAIASKVGLRK